MRVRLAETVTTVKLLPAPVYRVIVNLLAVPVHNMGRAAKEGESL
jgi:hypothetical protein